MPERLERMLTRWIAAGLLDAEGAERIRRFESGRAPSTHLRWPMRLAIGFGALMLSAGVLLFVASHWDALAPVQRFALVLILVAVFHVSAAAVSEGYPALSEGLHGIGTVSLGAGIFLSGQIFNMAEHWPAGLLLWAAGAWLAWWMLRHNMQLFLAALLTPAWLVGEWLLVLERAQWRSFDSDPILPAGLVLIALAYFTSTRNAGQRRSLLVVLGGVILIPAMLLLALVTTSPVRPVHVSRLTLGAAWAIAAGLPLALSVFWRREDAWVNAVATAWVLLLLWMSRWGVSMLLYAWWALGAIGLVAWGVRERRTERINLGAAVFAVTVVFFYFSSVMDKLGRAASLIGFGLLFLAGGWGLEHMRRQLVRTARESNQ